MRVAPPPTLTLHQSPTPDPDQIGLDRGSMDPWILEDLETLLETLLEANKLGLSAE